MDGNVRTLGAGTRIWAVGGGKGGVGKSLVSTNVALALAERHMKVVLADADLGGANLHILFGLQSPKGTLGDLLSGDVQHLDEVLLPTGHPRLHLLAGAGAFLGLADPGSQSRDLLLAELARLDADVVLLDLGAGSSNPTLDFWNFARVAFVVCSPEPTAVQNAYSFLKMALLRRIETVCAERPDIVERLAGPAGLVARMQSQRLSDLTLEIARIDRRVGARARRAVEALGAALVVNQAGPGDGERIAGALSRVSSLFLGIDLAWIGAVPESAALKRSVRAMKPFFLQGGDAEAIEAFREIALHGLKGTRRSLSASARPARSKPAARSTPYRTRAAAGAEARGRGARTARASARLSKSDDVRLGRRVWHVHTEDLGKPSFEVLSVVYENGRVLDSRRSSYEQHQAHPELARTVAQLLERQHRAMRDRVAAGRYAIARGVRGR